jgi:hypothetical protein
MLRGVVLLACRIEGVTLRALINRLTRSDNTALLNCLAKRTCLSTWFHHVLCRTWQLTMRSQQ